MLAVARGGLGLVAGSGRGRQFARKTGHLNGGEASLETFVAALEAGAVNRLLQRVTGENAECHGHACIELGKLDAAGDFAGDVFEMRSLAAQDTSDAYNRIAAARGREFFRGDGDF